MNAPTLTLAESLARAYALNVRQHVFERDIARVIRAYDYMREHYDVDESLADVFNRHFGRAPYDRDDVSAGRCTQMHADADSALLERAEQDAEAHRFWFDADRIERAMLACGYVTEQTGGGCTAYERILPSGKRIMVTDDDPSVPYWGGSIVVGLYPPNEEECSEALAYAMLAFEEPAEHPESLDDAPAGQYGVDYYSGEHPVIDESSAPAELLDEVRAIIAGLNAVSGPADADVTPKYAPGTVGAEVSPVFRMVLHPEILAIEATSCVGESVVELCRAVGTVLALRTPDHEGPGSSIDPEHRATLLAVVRDQSNLWYFG